MRAFSRELCNFFTQGPCFQSYQGHKIIWHWFCVHERGAHAPRKYVLTFRNKTRTWKIFQRNKHLIGKWQNLFSYVLLFIVISFFTSFPRYFFPRSFYLFFFSVLFLPSFLFFFILFFLILYFNRSSVFYSLSSCFSISIYYPTLSRRVERDSIHFYAE